MSVDVSVDPAKSGHSEETGTWHDPFIYHYKQTSKHVQG